MTDKEKRIRSLVAYRSVISLEDIDGVLSPLQQRHLRCEIIKSQKQEWITGEKLSSKQTGSQASWRPPAPTKAEKIGARNRKHCYSFTMWNMRGTVSVGKANRSSTSTPKGERKYETKRVERYFILNTRICDSLLVHGVRYIEVQRGYRSTIESEMIVTLMTLPVILLSGQLAKQFFHAGKSELASCL